MKKTFFLAITAMFATFSFFSCQSKGEGQTMSIQQILEQRHAVRAYTNEPVGDDVVMDILWAANGVSRKDGRRTAPSAVNAQDIDLYVCTEEGAFKYIPQPAALEKVTDRDIRPLFMAQNEYMKQAPLSILLVSDQTKFGEPRPGNRNLYFGFIDAGLVSENISLYCTAIGLGTVCCGPRMEIEEIQKALGLSEQHIPIVYHPIGYPAE